MHSEADFESMEDNSGLGLVVGVLPTMTLTSGRLRLVWDQWYII